MNLNFGKTAGIAIVVLALSTIVGCSSEVDKCVAASLKAGEPYKDAQQKAEIEAAFRLNCLRAQAGK